MQFGMWDTLFNMILLVFWFRIWTPEEDRNVIFNPYLSPIGRLAGAAGRFLRPVFFGLSERLIMFGALVFLIVFRGVIFHGMMSQRVSTWILRIGFERQMNAESAVLCIVFSFLSFGIFLFNIWGISLIYVRAANSDRATAALSYLSRPLADVASGFRPVAALLFGMALAAGLDLAGMTPLVPSPATAMPGSVHWASGEAVVNLLKLAFCALAGWTNLLLVIQSLMIVLIIGSWVAMFASSPGVMFFCKEWLDMILGPVRRFPIRIGMIDLTPLVFIIGIGIVHMFLQGFLAAGYHMLI